MLAKYLDCVLYDIGEIKHKGRLEEVLVQELKKFERAYPHIKLVEREER